jgi:TnpA family transposase
VKTIFLARYLHSLALRREIHEGLNTIERWNGANDFIYFARRGIGGERTRDPSALDQSTGRTSWDVTDHRRGSSPI